jgi:hypothetical protein
MLFERHAALGGERLAGEATLTLATLLRRPSCAEAIPSNCDAPRPSRRPPPPSLATDPMRRGRWWRHRRRSLLLSSRTGNATLSAASPPLPCLLEVGVLRPEALPPHLPRPSPSSSSSPSLSTSCEGEGEGEGRGGGYPRHVLMLTRGTRGDVQPFVALARGMAQSRGWLVP